MSGNISFFKRTVELKKKKKKKKKKKQVQIYGKEMPHSQITEQTMAPRGVNIKTQIQIDIQRILGGCILISILPGKASRTLVEMARLAERLNKRSRSRS